MERAVGVQSQDSYSTTSPLQVIDDCHWRAEMLNIPRNEVSTCSSKQVPESGLLQDIAGLTGPVLQHSGLHDLTVLYRVQYHGMHLLAE